MSKNIEIIQCNSFYHILVTLGKGDVNIIKNSLPEDGFPIVESSNVRKSYVLMSLEIPILSDVNFRIERGEFLVIKSSSSSEKSIPVNRIGCLDGYTEGHALLRETNINREPGQEFANLWDLEIGFVFQCFNLVPRLNAIQNVLLSTFASLRNGSDPKKRAREPFEIVKPHGLTHQIPREFSEGHLGRDSTTHASISGPATFLANEPIGNLDPITRNEILRMLFHLNMEARSLVITANNPEIAKYSGIVYQVKDRITQYN